MGSVKTRYKASLDGKSYVVYFDVYDRGKRHKVYPGIKVSRDLGKAERLSSDEKKTLYEIENKRKVLEVETFYIKDLLYSSSTTQDNFIMRLEETFRLSRVNTNVSKMLISYLKRNYPVSLRTSDITTLFCMKVKSHIIDNYKPNSAETLFSHFKRCLKELGITSAMSISSPKREDTSSTVLNLGEIELLYKTVDVRWRRHPMPLRWAFIFACFTGLRYGDVKKLKWNAIIGEKNDTLVIVVGKTRRILYIPLLPDAIVVLREMKKRYPDTEHVFNKLPRPNKVSVQLKYWASISGITKRLHFHAARHTFATIGINAGVDLYTMKELLGHANIKMTLHYAKLSDGKKREELKKFPTLLNQK